MKIGETKIATELFGFNKTTEFDDKTLTVWNGNVGTVVDNSNWKSSTYIEHGLLEPISLVDFHETDNEGREVGSLGIFKVKPEWFDVTLNETYDKTLTYYRYKLNENGWNELEKLGLKHPGRGWVGFDFLPHSELKMLIERQKSSISNSLNWISKSEKLL